ncbi:hypothetical protein [Pseudochryseolinea flava]|nr:hypothetical protein [Pseudochryseolinea flava]
MIADISNDNWITKLDVIDRASYRAKSQQTVDRLIKEIFSNVSTKLTEEFGEYLISYSATKALEKVYKHVPLPLAELWKERIVGNAGFDFHTESPDDLIVFGESKFSSSKNPHTIALDQIAAFVKAKKDEMDLSDLRRFARQSSVQNVIANHKAYVAAFSLNGKRHRQIFNTALKSENINALLCHAELYLVGIKYEPK